MLTLSSLKLQLRQFVAPGLAAVLGVAFVAATLSLSASLTNGVLSALTGDLKNYDAVVATKDPMTPGAITPAQLTTVEATEGVESVRAIRQANALIDGDWARVTTPPASSSAAELTEGSMPEADGETAISTQVAASSGAKPGDRIQVQGIVDSKDAPARRLTVVGIVDASGDPRFGSTPVAFTTAESVALIGGSHDYVELDITTSTEGAMAAIRKAVGTKDGVVVRTGEEHAKALADQVGGTMKAITGFMLGFAAIALFVAAIVVGNTMTILHARRARETALLRCVGATRRQVIRSALAESTALGVVVAALGVGLGLALSWGLGHLAGSTGMPSSFTASTYSVMVPFVVGVVLLVCASLVPVLRASKVAPLAALRPEEAVHATSRRGRVRITAGLLLAAMGVALLILGATAGQVAIGIGGGVLSFAGVLMAGSVIVPLLVLALGRVPARALGICGDLAVENTTRNPGRAASTAMALLVGVTLVVMTLVGGATGKATTDQALDKQYAVDLSVTADTSLPSTVAAAVAEVDGVGEVTEVTGAAVRIGSRNEEVAGIPANAQDVLRDPSVTSSLSHGTLIAAEPAPDIRDGDTVTVTGPSGSRDFEVHIDHRLGLDFAVTAEDLAAIDDRASVRTVLARLDDGSDADASVNAVREATRGIEGVKVGGGAELRAQIDEALAITMWIVLALLAVSVLIATVGVANTLSLSVLERSRESALLRALGTTAGQIRGMLAVEGVLLAVVGTAIGVLLGVGYAIAGVASLIGNQQTVVIAIPWASIGLVVLGAVLAGLLASVMPALRAGRIPPAAALAVD